jgi:hypothetical protein
VYVVVREKWWDSGKIREFVFEIWWEPCVVILIQVESVFVIGLAHIIKFNILLSCHVFLFASSIHLPSDVYLVS